MKRIVRLTESDIRQMVMETIDVMSGMDPESMEDEYAEEQELKKHMHDDDEY